MRNRSISLLPVLAVAAALNLLGPAQASAETTTFGWLEWAYLGPDYIRIKTKLDTGAKTSSVHAEQLVPFEQDGQPWIRFTIPISRRPDDSDHGKDLILERPIVRRTVIKEHNGKNDSRYVVNMRVCLGGNFLSTPVTLADRTKFNYPLLLGRTTLAGIAVVDPAKTFTAGKRCKSRKKARVSESMDDTE